jgi:DnaJ-class molecular chaperone
MTGRVALTVPSGTQNGRSFRLAGKGMPKLGTSSACGDLYATVRVVLPESFTEEERVLFEKMRQIKKRKVPGTGSARR